MSGSEKSTLTLGFSVSSGFDKTTTNRKAYGSFAVTPVLCGRVGDVGDVISFNSSCFGRLYVIVDIIRLVSAVIVDSQHPNWQQKSEK